MGHAHRPWSATTGAWRPGTLLDRLREADRTALVSLGSDRRYSSGEALMLDGDSSTDAFVVLGGCVKVLGGTVDGRTVLLSLRGAGDMVGELAAMNGTPRSASVFAATAVRVRVIPARSLRTFMAERPEAATAIHASVADKFRRATRHRVDFTTASTLVRLALALQHLAEAYGRPYASGVRIEVPLSQPELASLVGVSDPSLQRAFRRLREHGLIKTEYRRQIVCRPDLLRHLVEKGTLPPPAAQEGDAP
ncbi:Crp/Fnr family transcriptional regulator [Micromonospora echinospora]|uniref:Crp/Fnr family transcriptional regulator n=1 Tax=Micromonospora echinospora TaxID=1877 RepID=UPI00366D3404